MSTSLYAKVCVSIGFMVLAQGCSLGPSREQAEQSGKNLGKICEAIITYSDARKVLPTRALMTKDGKPGLSWRVTILPYLGEDALYREFQLDEPWDSAHNRPLVEKMPAVYRSPMTKAEPGFTNYLSVVGPLAVLADNSPITMRKISDGTAQTVMILEANDAVEWTKPDDYIPPKDDPAAGLGKLHPKGYFIAGFPSGDTSFVPTSLDAQSLAAMFTRSGGEAFSWLKYSKDKRVTDKENGFK
jgi:hypothetical protein